MNCRETFDIWWRLKTMPSTLLQKSFWYRGFGKNGYLWHDSFGKYFRRFLGCKHEPTFLDSDNSCDGQAEIYCFKCERKLPQ